MDFSILAATKNRTSHEKALDRGHGVRHRGRFAAFFMALCIAIIPAGTPVIARPIGTQDAQTATEAQIKAAFVLNFARFTDWPAVTLPEASPVVIFCFDGAEDVRVAFEALSNGKEIMGRKIVNRKLTNTANAQSCHALFANDSKNTREVEVLRIARDAGALTIGDGPEFLTCGGMIQLVVDDNKMRFDINMNPVNRAKLKLSSKLLALARHVVDHAGEGAH